MSDELHFRSVVDPRDHTRYAQWVRELRDRNGAYVIRDRLDGTILYVGESHSRRLRSTLTRHFQSWNGYQAGTLYSRHRVEVALVALNKSPSAVVSAQVALIEELAPADNTHYRRQYEWEEDEGDASFDVEDFA